MSAVHQAYVDAGSDIILTNSFGGASYRLRLHGEVFECNKAAARVARDVCDATERGVLVAGSLGPTGELLEPMGTMIPSVCADAFTKQAEGLHAGGADLLWIETMSDLDELQAAVEGARRASDLPICATVSFDTAGRTMMGVSGTDAVDRLAEFDVTAMGANCGNNLPDTEAALKQMRAQDAEILLISKANAGMPEWHGADLHYSGTPEVMGAYGDRLRSSGVSLIGACWGSTPEHIAFMGQVLDGDLPVHELELRAAASNLVATGSTRPNRRRSRSKTGRSEGQRLRVALNSTMASMISLPGPPLVGCSGRNEIPLRAPSVAPTPFAKAARS